jgi:hypothetical protein
MTAPSTSPPTGTFHLLREVAAAVSACALPPAPAAPIASLLLLVAADRVRQ